MSHEMRVPLDAAIDRVATQLVSVEPDRMLADRIASRLPERSTRPWIASLVPQLAAAMGVALLAFILFSNRSTKEADPIAASVAPHKGAPYETSRGASYEKPEGAPDETGVTSTVVARQDPRAAIVDHSFDHDYGLRPVARPEAIVLAAIDTEPAIDVPSAQLAPIVLTDLPLASDSPSRR